LSDPLQNILQEDIASSDAVLWVADENCSETLLDSLPPHFEILTNRWGLYQYALGLGLSAHFNDFDFSVLASPKTRIYYRISKEKPVVHHVIKSSFEALMVGGKFIVWGEKKSGIKTYTKKANRLFGCSSQAKKSSSDYVAVLEKSTVAGSAEDEHDLDDSDYADLRRAIHFGDASLFTKPGLFGWDKVDRGSSLLIEHLSEFLSGFKARPESVLDMGCGYGLLTVATAEQGIADITAVDNCAAALLACEKNMRELCQVSYKNFIESRAGSGPHAAEFKGRIVAADCRPAYADNFDQEVNQQFDAVLCNPPFHQGFDTERELTEAFVMTAARQLKRRGQALFVTNRFVGLEKIAQDFFSEVTILAENREFRLTVMKHKKHRL